MSESFLSRWSRRKRASMPPHASEAGGGEGGERSEPGGGDTHTELSKTPPTPDPSPPFAARTGGGEPQASAPHAADFDPATLPPIESIDAGTDVSAFLRPGVPAELTQAALRRAWSADPAIRDFVGLAENAWDFNAPGGVPGFEPLRAIDDVQRLAAQVMGALPAAASESADAERGKDIAEKSEETPQQTPAAAPQEVAPASADDAAPQQEIGRDDERSKMALRHGGALPE